MRVHSLRPNRESLRRAFSLLPLLLMVSGLRAASGQSAGHPLDPLAWEEHWIVLDAIHTAGHATDSTRYSLVSLQPLAKSDVLAWRPGQPFSRAAFAIVKEGARTFEAEVDLNHDHFFSFRLDLDVDGPVNSLQIDRLVTQRLPDYHPRRSVWVVEPSLAGSEADAKLRIDLEHPALWRVINPTTDNGLGYPVTYQLVAGANAVSLIGSGRLSTDAGRLHGLTRVGDALPGR